MPIVLNQIKLPIEENESSLSMHAARALAVPARAILGLRVARISLDARKKDAISFNYTLEVTLSPQDEARLAKKGVALAQPLKLGEPIFGTKPLDKPIIVVGLGPAGLFAAYTLALSALLQMSSVFAYKSSGYTVVIALITAGMLIFITAAVVLAYMKNAELELKSRLTRLETARSLEEESYHRTLERIEAMAKLRHDFYGQLQAARYLLEADPEEGRKMLEDMMIALPKQK